MIEDIIRFVLKKIVPSEKERNEVRRVMKKITNITERVLRPYGLSYTLSGSMTRDTWMPEKKEFDIFILFPENTPRTTLEKQGIEIGKKIIKSAKGSYTIAYAEHPYTRGKIGKFEIDIVPCYKISSPEKIKSSVDRTPFHNKWIEKNLPLTLSNEVRLLKQFTKNIGIYGSDAKTMGFSGYLCEILIVYYGSFLKLITSAMRWKPGKVFIDIEKYYKDEAYRKKILKKFDGQPLIVIDPVDRMRNVAAALSPENFIRFVNACKGFVSKPSKSFFFSKPKPTNIEKIMRERETGFLCVVFKKPDIIPDILWPQLRKTKKRLINILEEYEFRPIGSTIHENDKYCFIVIELESLELPNLRKIVGPSIFTSKRSNEFIKKYKKRGRVWVEEKYWFAEVQREFKNAIKKLSHTLNVPLKTLLAKGIPSYIAKEISRYYKILNTKEIIDLSKRDSGFSLHMKRYFEESV